MKTVLTDIPDLKGIHLNVMRALDEGPGTVADVDRRLNMYDPGTIFILLLDLVAHGLVTREEIKVKSADGKYRKVGKYSKRGTS